MELPFLLLLWELSDPRIPELCEMPRSFSIKLHSETQDRLGMSGGGSPSHARKPLSGERRKTLSITHHAIKPTSSSVYHSSHQLTTTFLSYYLKDTFVPKSDVKQ